MGGGRAGTARDVSAWRESTASYRMMSTHNSDALVKNRLPSMSTQGQLVEAGGLMAYGPSLPVIYRRAAIYVDKILKGAKPSDLPIEEPTRFELVINVETAKALGLTIPPSLLLRADQVIG
jgi:putative tryptophan/tyrosine transport system substrate-binding protein